MKTVLFFVMLLFIVKSNVFTERVASSEVTPEETEVTNVVTSRPAIGQMNSPISLSCDLKNAPEGDIVEKWTRNRDAKVVSGGEVGYIVKSSRDNATLTSTLTINGTVNTQDGPYTCSFAVTGQDPWTGTCLVFLFLVTPQGATVDKGQPATLSCVITDIVKNLTVTWEDENGEDILGLSEHSFIQGTNTDGVQETTLPVEEAVSDATYTCTVYPYQDEPYSTNVMLFVNSAGRLASFSIVFSLLAVFRC